MSPQQEVKFDAMHDTVIKLDTFIRESIVKDLNDHDKTLYGNGVPGLKERGIIADREIKQLHKMHADCESKREKQKDRKPSHTSNMIAVGALIVALLAIFVK